MQSESWFKMVFVVTFAYAVTVAAVTARRSTRKNGTSLNQLAHEVPGLIAVRAILGLVFYVMLGIWLFRSEPVAWAQVPLASPVRWGAAMLLLPTLAFFSWSFLSLGTNYRGGVGLYPAHTLITSGAYRWVRHPIYVAFVAIMFLVLILTANWVLGGAGLALVITIAAARIPTEERELRERFGAQWESYRSQTGLLLPRI